MFTASSALSFSISFFPSLSFLSSYLTFCYISDFLVLSFCFLSVLCVFFLLHCLLPACACLCVSFLCVIVYFLTLFQFWWFPPPPPPPPMCSRCVCVCVCVCVYVCVCVCVWGGVKQSLFTFMKIWTIKIIV